MKTKRSRLSQAKAREMLHNPPGGRPLSKAQRGYFGLVAGGKKSTRLGGKKRER